MTRPDGRAADELRPISFERDYTEMAAGSCLVTFGRTRVLCTASIDEDVPRWMRGSGKGWVTAEYSMLPGSSPERIDREAAQGQAERAHDRDPAPDRPLAAGRVRHDGARRAPGDRRLRRAPGRRRHPHGAICGGYLALHDALGPARAARRARPTHPLHSFCAAISVGIVDGVPVLDLPYVEDRGRGRHERGDAAPPRGEPLRRGAGHGRGHAPSAAASSTRCWRSPRAGSPRSSRCRRDGGCAADAAAGRCAMTRSARLRLRQPRQGRRDRGHSRAGAVELLPAPGGRARRRRGRRHVRGQRPAEGGRPSARPRACRRSPTTPGSRSTRSAARRACTRPATRARTARTPTTGASCSRELDGVPIERAARFRTVALVCWPDGRELAVEGVCRGHDRRRRTGARRVRLRPDLRAGRGRRPHVRAR